MKKNLRNSLHGRGTPPLGGKGIFFLQPLIEGSRSAVNFYE